MKKVLLACATKEKPYRAFLDSLEAQNPVLREAGWEDLITFETGHAYVSYAQALLCKRFLDNPEYDTLVFVEADMKWPAESMLKLLNTPGDIVGATYRFKSPDEDYMGRFHEDEEGRPNQIRYDGCLSSIFLPTGFLKISRGALEMIAERYPHLRFGEPGSNHFDFFNHGVIENIWFGQDYAFCLRWKMMKQKIWCIPDLDITHCGFNVDGDYFEFPGNFHKWLLTQPTNTMRKRWAERSGEYSVKTSISTNEPGFVPA